MAKRFECFYCGKQRAARSAYIHRGADGKRIGYRCNTRRVKCAGQPDRRAKRYPIHIRFGGPASGEPVESMNACLGDGNRFILFSDYSGKERGMCQPCVDFAIYGV